MPKPRLTAKVLYGLRVAIATCPAPPRHAPPGHYGPEDRAALRAALAWVKAMELHRRPHEPIVP